jgi:Ca-activated chloride channel family protein
MAPPERLPLIKSALSMFVDTLRADDRLAIVTYAGTSGVALPSTPIRHREIVQTAIARLQAGGSTNGGSGLITAYRVAREAFIPGGVNRVILASDGDFNVGIVNQRDLLQLIERERESGVFLSVLGVGSGNLKDATMEMLADRGNGHYAYLDSLQEARRVLLREADSTVETVAKDVKFQVEFNPAMVSAWKLIGYENRLLATEDFNDDRKDGGEMGAGHTVTVLYEIVPVGVPVSETSIDRPVIDPLRYRPAATQTRDAPQVSPPAATLDEWLTVKTRYKAPEGDVSTLIVTPVKRGDSMRHLAAASVVAEFGLLLRSGHRDPERWDDLMRRVARVTLPGDAAGAESFRELVDIAAGLLRR